MQVREMKAEARRAWSMGFSAFKGDERLVEEWSMV